MINSTFFGFTSAQRAMNASQQALNVTGQNISNVNTDGYARQRVDLASAGSTSNRSMYAMQGSFQVGGGVDINGISQIRNPFLDVRYRKETAQVGEQDAKLSSLNDLEKVFDEVANTGVSAQIDDFIKQLNAYSQETGSAEFDSIARSSADMLIKSFNQYAMQLEAARGQQESDFQKIALDSFNSILQNIAGLNQSIKENAIHGDPSLELSDQRNLLLDQLSQFMDISVSYRSVAVNSERSVEEMIITAKGSDPTKDVALLDHTAAASVVWTSGGPLAITDAAGVLVNRDGNDLNSGSIKGYLTMLNGGGEFDVPRSDRGLAYYEKMLNTVVAKFAAVMNSANDPSGTNPRPLFSTRDGSPDFTAKNIGLSQGWVDNTYGITASRTPDLGIPGSDNSGKRDNVLYIISLFSQKLDFKTPESFPGAGDEKLLFNGSFEECFGNISVVLGVEKQAVQQTFKNKTTVQNALSDAREGISSVSLDEEGINLLRYQKSYNAAARLMTTLDEALDVVINRMGIVGR